MEDLLTQWAGEISIAVALIIFMWQERKSRHQLETQQLEVKKQQNKYHADEQERVDKRAGEMVTLYAGMVEQQKAMTAQTERLTAAIKGLAVYEQQNQKLLERVVGSQADNTTALATITGAMDAAVASLVRIETALNNGNADYVSITQTLVKVTAALKRIEAKLPTPPPTKPDIPLHKPVAHDGDEQEQIPA